MPAVGTSSPPTAPRRSASGLVSRSFLRRCARGARRASAITAPRQSATGGRLRPACAPRRRPTRVGTTRMSPRSGSGAARGAGLYFPRTSRRHCKQRDDARKYEDLRRPAALSPLKHTHRCLPVGKSTSSPPPHEQLAVVDHPSLRGVPRLATGHLCSRRWPEHTRNPAGSRTVAGSEEEAF